jgi:dihydrofolate synthase/folylpolyglutamate synthase
MSTSLSSWLEALEGRHFKAIDLGLERCSEVWRALGEPRPAARIITVAGTNGKGSVVAYLAAILGSTGQPTLHRMFCASMNGCKFAARR